MMKKVLIILIFIGLFYRVYGLIDNHSFWTDENHVAIFVRAISERGKPVLANDYSTGAYQWLQYQLSAFSAQIFGLNEFAIRFPSVIFGVLTIWAVYLLGKELFNEKTGLVAAFFTTFLKIEILMSRQARPYQALQFFYLLAVFFLYRLVKNKKFNWRYFIGFLACGFSALLMHGLGLVIFFSAFLYLLIFRFYWFKKWVWAVGSLVFLLLAWRFWFYVSLALSGLGKINNLFYYRVFLWHNYSLLVFLAGVGFLASVFREKKKTLILALVLLVQGAVTAFFLDQPFVRYFYIVFPFLILLAAAGLVVISQTFRRKQLALIVLTLFIIGMGHKFTFKPKRTYSLNEDMQEVPEVDWKKIYQFVEEKLEENPEAVLVTNWNDPPVWYLGEESLDYLIRKPVPVRKDSLSSAETLFSVDEFEAVVDQYLSGLLIIDSWDNLIPDGVREYARDSLEKEFEVDRLYPVQPRYWPVNVYSWGLK